MGKRYKDTFAKERGLRITRIMSRDGDICCLCGRKLDRHIKDELSPEYISFDHIIPLSKGGDDKDNSVRLAHQLCNWKRGNKD